MRKSVLLIPFAIAACATAPAGPPVHGGGSGFVCRGDDLARFAGQSASKELGVEMLRASGARVIRWVAHGMKVTMEFSPERLTVWLTPDNRVERVNCG